MRNLLCNSVEFLIKTLTYILNFISQPYQRKWQRKGRSLEKKNLREYDTPVCIEKEVATENFVVPWTTALLPNETFQKDTVNSPQTEFPPSPPQKSFQKQPPTPRPLRSIVKEDFEVSDILTEKRHCYKSFHEFCKRAQSLKIIQEWCTQAKEDRMVFRKWNESSVCLPQLELVVDDSLGFTILVYGWLLPDDHILYTKYYRSMRNVTLNELVRKLTESFIICPGIEQPELNSNIIHHVINCNIVL